MANAILLDSYFTFNTDDSILYRAHTVVDRSCTSYLLATLVRDVATTVVVARNSEEEKEVGTNPCELAISQGERGAGIGNGVLARCTVPDLNQLFEILLADSEGGRVGNRKLCRLSTVAVSRGLKHSPVITRRVCRPCRAEITTEDDLNCFSRRWNSARSTPL